MPLFSALAGMAAEYNSACVNTLRRSQDGCKHPSHQSEQLWWLFLWGITLFRRRFSLKKCIKDFRIDFQNQIKRDGKLNAWLTLLTLLVMTSPVWIFAFNLVLHFMR